MIKKIAAAMLVVVALLACATGAEARSPWQIQQRYQKNYQRDIRHPATSRPLYNYRKPYPAWKQQRYGQPKVFQFNLGKFRLSIGGGNYCPQPFHFHHR